MNEITTWVDYPPPEGMEVVVFETLEAWCKNCGNLITPANINRHGKDFCLFPRREHGPPEGRFDPPPDEEFVKKLATTGLRYVVRRLKSWAPA